MHGTKAWTSANHKRRERPPLYCNASSVARLARTPSSFWREGRPKCGGAFNASIEGAGHDSPSAGRQRGALSAPLCAHASTAWRHSPARGRDMRANGEPRKQEEQEETEGE
jgi:hypothetical protein